MTEKTNALHAATSAYLRSAMHQPIDWQEWGAAAFERAKQEGKPVLLDIGAVWCHWCHVMDRESYENPAIAKIINENYVAVKVDRDERPDVDSRYQAAVQAVSGQGGWPLTAFLTSDGRPFFGGTYFPPDDRYGRAGFRRVLLTLAQAFREKPEDIEESAQGVMAAVSRGEAFEGHTGEVSLRIVESIVQSALKQFDSAHGGFGTQPKFPHPSAIELLILEYARTKDAELRSVIEKTLDAMAKGGIYDQIGGGFHRYSVDDKWIVPHFEKMAYDNAQLLRNYAWAARAFGREDFKAVALDIARWMREVLSDEANGGFYASQDADIDLDDDGDYFTWTLQELGEALGAEDAEFARALYDIEPVGEMHHNPAKNVLWVATTNEEMATRFGLSAEEVRDRITRIKTELAAKREQRKAPFIDTTKYVHWNALCVSAFLSLAQAYPEQTGVKQFAIKTLDAIWSKGWREQGGLRHVIDGADVSGMLDDYASTLQALIEAYELTSEREYLENAETLGRRLNSLFYDEKNGGFFDVAHDASGRVGALTAARKPVQDAPTPAGNSVAALALLRLYALTGREEYRLGAEATLNCFAGIIEQFGYFAAAYGIAAREILRPPAKAIVMGSSEQADAMWRQLQGEWNPDRIDIRVSTVDELPAALAEMMTSFGQEAAVTVLCAGFTCMPPVRTAEAVRGLLR